MPILEICVDTLADFDVAVSAGADRIELCASLSVGGLSPSFALLQATKNASIPVNVMIRPRAGDFLYSKAERAAMCEEIKLVKEMGLSGVVVGCGDESGLAYDHLQELCKAAKGMDITLHRVVDLSLPKPINFDRLEAMGIRRILSSGGATTAQEGLEELVKLAKQAPDSITIMPGSGINPDNIAKIKARTKTNELHASASKVITAEQTRASHLGFIPKTTKATCGETIRRLKAEVGE